MKKGLLIIGLLLIIGAIGYYINNNDQPHIQDKEDKQVVDKTQDITYEELLSFINDFKCGDIINIENSNYLSSYVIPGRWKHSLIYVGTLTQMQSVYDDSNPYYQKLLKRYHQGDEILVIDSNNTGVKIRELKQMANLEDISYLKAINVDRFNESNEFLSIYINTALNYLNTPYDFEMESYDDSKLYCSELIYYSLLQVNYRIDQSTKILDVEVITPTNLVDYLESLDNISRICLIEKIDNQLVRQ